MSERNLKANLFLYAVGIIFVLTHFGYGGQTNSTNAGVASLIVTNQNSSGANPTEITTLDGTTYKSVRIQQVEPDGLMIQYAPPTGGIGLGKIKFVNLPAELQSKYRYDAQKASEYQAEQGASEAKLRKELQAQQEQAWAAERARAEDNFKARQEIDKQAEAVRVQAEKERQRIKAEADRNKDTTTTSTGSGRRSGSGRR